jgi:dTDP-4-dehydro-6-deoxy-alpha-D-glucopyranose 2,3-dehydratase
MMDRKTVHENFLSSSQAMKCMDKDIPEVLKWMEQRKSRTSFDVRKIRFKDMDQWAFNGFQGDLRHRTGQFFSIEGIQVETNWGLVSRWCQPIIHQPEIGFLGIITKKIDGILHFLMQAKIEPGNINGVQLSPTLQATRSNYTRVHEGRSPPYLEYFLERGKARILVDQLQSEHGTRFLRKRNRNIIIQVDEDIPVHENFIWLTLGQIKDLIRADNIVNMDARTVISCIPVGEKPANPESSAEQGKSSSSEDEFRRGMLSSAYCNEAALHDIDDIISWLVHLKTKFDLKVKNIPLKDVLHWRTTEDSIHHEERKYFEIIAVSVSIRNREIENWTQPLVAPAQEGILAFVIKRINGVYHFLVQAKMECGNHDVLELAPTVQCLTGNYRDTPKGSLPYLDYVLEADGSRIRFDSMQSEEGGRFYREQNRNVIIEAESDFEEHLPENYIWMTLEQMRVFLKFNNYLNVQARSLIAALPFH